MPLRPRAHSPTPASRPPSPARDLPRESARLAVLLPAPILDELRRVAYWDRQTLPQVIVAALEREFAAREAARGVPYPPQAAPLKTGRPLKLR